ncbi:hypothetical protein C8J56DRAFT_1025256 [Mycena floridula]|nr:hypothetical protein C8J56DRAFT_1025256 [Mycena floridula]
MKLSSVLAALTSLAVVSALSCDEASRFGDLTVSPTDLTPGASFTIALNLTCAITHSGHIPKFLDYSLVVPFNNNGFEPDIVIARRNFTPPADPSKAVDTFTAQLPFFGYDAGAAYNIELTMTYPEPASVKGKPDVLLQGGVFAPINISVS